MKRTPTEALQEFRMQLILGPCYGPGYFLRKPSVWFAFFVVISICLVHERSSKMVTPKYNAAGTLSSSTLCRMYLVLPFLSLGEPGI